MSWPFDTTNTDKLDTLSQYSNGLYGQGSGFMNRGSIPQSLSIPDNSGVVHIAPQSAAPIAQIPQMQAQKGLIGREFDSMKSQYLGSVEGGLANTATGGLYGQAQNYTQGVLNSPQFNYPQRNSSQDASVKHFNSNKAAYMKQTDDSDN